MVTLDHPVPIQDLKSDVKPIWCPGCGDYGVMHAVLKAVSELRLDPAHIVIASGIGCSGRFPAFVKTYGFHGVHGRALPLATGVKVANPDLTVLAVSGDGDGLSIGVGHIPHAARRNVDITYLILDNEVYGLTKGQPSPTSPWGTKTKASPYGTVERPLNPVAIMLACGTTFVARGFAARPQELAEIIRQGILHPGFAFIEIISPCVTFLDTYALYKQRVIPIPESHDRTDRMAALALAFDTEKIYLGIFYQDSDSRPHHAALREMREKLSSSYSLQSLLERFRR